LTNKLLYAKIIIKEILNMKNCKKNKKSHRARKRYRERKLVLLKLDIPKEYLLHLRKESQRTKKSVNKIIDTWLRIAMEEDYKKLKDTVVEENTEDVN
jgi:hypothetical protein